MIRVVAAEQSQGPTCTSARYSRPFWRSHASGRTLRSRVARNPRKRGLPHIGRVRPLRYLPPQMFWRDFFLRAVGSHSEGACSLSDYLTDSGVELLECDSLEVRFWPSHRSFGTPDLCLCFSGARTLPSVIMVEAKLGAGKSGAGEDDQLLRYLLLLRQLDELELPFRAADRKRAVKALLFLTPHRRLETPAVSRAVAGHTGRGIGVRIGCLRPYASDPARYFRFPATSKPRVLCRVPQIALPPTTGLGAFYGRKDIFGQFPIPPLDAGAGSFYKKRRQTSEDTKEA